MEYVDSDQCARDRLREEIAELETLLEQAARQDDDIDARWARELFRELIQRRKEQLRTLM